MARKPVPPDEHRQRTLEGTDDGPLRASVRDVVDGRVRWAWLREMLLRFVQYATAAALFVFLLWDRLVQMIGWLTRGSGSP